MRGRLPIANAPLTISANHPGLMETLTQLSQNLAIFLATLTIGWTCCISFAVAPTAFRELDRGRGDRFVRNIIKDGHGFLALLAALAAIIGLIAGAVGGAIVMGVVAFFYLMARFALAPRTDNKPKAGARKLKTARVASSALTFFIIPVALAALIMICFGV
jgi:hypothetical protein